MKFTEKDGKVGVEAKLCLVVKKKGVLIEEVFREGFQDLKVVNEGAEFEPKGQCKMTKGMTCLPCRSFCYWVMWNRNTQDLKQSLSVDPTRR